MRVACEKYGTSVMKQDEVLLFIEAALENGSEISEAFADVKMIDTMLYAELIYKANRHSLTKTSSGHYRKGSDMNVMFLKILEGRVNGAFDNVI
jgi:hypothetical protein